MKGWDVGASVSGCTKLGYHTRKKARRRAKKLYPGQHMDTWPCENGNHWHFGHMPDSLRRGEVDRATISKSIRRRDARRRRQAS